MALEIISKSISTNVMWPEWGSNSQPLNLQSDVLLAVLRSPGSEQVTIWEVKIINSKKMKDIQMTDVLPSQ